jgi:hypothetical protein
MLSYSKSKGLVGERVMFDLLESSSVEDARDYFTAEELKNVAKAHLIFKVKQYNHSAKINNDVCFEDLTAVQILDYIFGIDMLVKYNDKLVALDVASSPLGADNKLNRQPTYKTAYEALGISGFGVALCRYSLEPMGKDKENAVNLFETFVNKLANSKSLTCRQIFQD